MRVCGTALCAICMSSVEVGLDVVFDLFAVQRKAALVEQELQHHREDLALQTQTYTDAPPLPSVPCALLVGANASARAREGERGREGDTLSGTQGFRV
jgi:hypothetical protein